MRERQGLQPRHKPTRTAQVCALCPLRAQGVRSTPGAARLASLGVLLAQRAAHHRQLPPTLLPDGVVGCTHARSSVARHVSAQGWRLAPRRQVKPGPPPPGPPATLAVGAAPAKGCAQGARRGGYTPSPAHSAAPARRLASRRRALPFLLGCGQARHVPGMALSAAVLAPCWLAALLACCPAALLACLFRGPPGSAPPAGAAGPLGAHGPRPAGGSLRTLGKGGGGLSTAGHLGSCPDEGGAGAGSRVRGFASL